MQKINRGLVFIIIISLILTSFTFVNALSNPITISVEGKQVKFKSDSKPYVDKNGKIMLPTKETFEALG